MQCPGCSAQLPDSSNFCPLCGAEIPSIKVAVKERPNMAVFSGLQTAPEVQRVSEVAEAAGDADSASGISIDAPGRRPDVSTNQTETDEEKKPPQAAPQVAKRWLPKRTAVEAWALKKSLNHYEVLELEETASDELVRDRVQLLDDRLELWSKDATDDQLQIIGTNGKNRLFDLRAGFADRDSYHARIRREQHERALKSVSEEVRRYVEKDNVLQWDEWIAIERRARDEGLSEDELEAILKQQRERGVLTGLTIAGREVRTLLALRDRCRGRGEPLIDLLWNGELERWLEKAAQKPHLAEQVRKIKADYKGRELAGACFFLWDIDEKRLVLTGTAGEEEIESVKQWVEGVQHRGLEESTLAAMKDGRLADWLKLAMKQDALAEIAGRKRDEGRRGLLELIGQVEVRRGKSFKFKNGEASSVAELITKCDEYPEEAVKYLFNGYFEKWLGEIQGEGSLALQAHEHQKNYANKKRIGLELFTRELCQAVGSNPYPHITAQPARLDFGVLPVGKQASASIQTSNNGRGYAWGTVSLEPELIGVSVAPKFDGMNAAIDLNVDTLRVAPADCKTNIVIRAEGVPTPCVIPLQYQVAPLKVHLEPLTIDFGSIPHGRQQTSGVRVKCTPDEGRLVGTPKIEPACEGVKVSGGIDGAAGDLEVEVDTSPLEPGRSYETAVYLQTNVGDFQIPVRFSPTLRWDVVATWTAGLAIATGIGMWICRYILAGAAAGLDAWQLSYTVATTEVLWACGVFAALLLGTIGLIIQLKFHTFTLRNFKLKK
jgi:hypothetical protein